jgi:two-component system cell cycle sensor histidine kinase/response regulator CckA
MAVKKNGTARAGAVRPYSMLHDIPGAAAVLSYDGAVHAWNDEAAELLGWRVPLRAPRLGSRSSPWLRRLLERVERNGDGAVVMGHRRGDRRIALELRARNAQQGELLVLLRECTGQLRSRRARRDDERGLRAFFDQLPEPIIVEQLDTVVYANDAAARLIGFHRADDLIGVPIERVLRAGVRARALRNNDNHTVAAGAVETSIQREAGPPATVRVTAQRLYYRRRRAVHYLLRDVTDRQQAEDNLRRSEEQLRQAQKMDAVGRLAAGIAHDFNNIMTAIQGHAQFLIEDLPPVFASRDDAIEIKRAAERATELTRQLLTFARRQPTQPVALDVNDAVLSLEKMLRRLLPTDIRLDIITGDVATVFIDPTHFEQVVVNLAVNARDAMGSGGVVTIRTSMFVQGEADVAQDVDMRPGEYVQLTVSDTGRGMSEEVQSHIFEPFFTTKTEGTGLGLPTVYGIVQQARGCVSVSSREGAGTTFSVFLPVVQRTHRRAMGSAPAGEPVPSTG